MNWISIGAQLPMSGERVLAWAAETFEQDLEVTLARFDGVFFHHGFLSSRELRVVTHWMRLPDEPK